MNIIDYGNGWKSHIWNRGYGRRQDWRYKILKYGVLMFKCPVSFRWPGAARDAARDTVRNFQVSLGEG